MSDKCMDTLRCSPSDLRQAMSIHTRKITDACRDQDCIEDLRVYLPCCAQEALDGCGTVRVRCAELIHARMEVEPVAFDRNHYCIDVTFYYRITVDVSGCGRPFDGLAMFSKRVVLCGEESRAHIYRSTEPDLLHTATAPTAVVEVLDPMVLSFRVRDRCDCGCDCECEPQIPCAVRSLFGEDLGTGREHRRLYVTLGQFSIIRLEREAQLVVPVLDYAIPTKECCESDGGSETPCEMFGKIPFPTAQFSPRGCDCAEERHHCC